MIFNLLTFYCCQLGWISSRQWPALCRKYLFLKASLAKLFQFINCLFSIKVGGFDGTTYLKTIEVYDKEANNWKLCGSMNCRRLGGGVGVVMSRHDAHFW